LLVLVLLVRDNGNGWLHVLRLLILVLKQKQKQKQMDGTIRRTGIRWRYGGRRRRTRGWMTRKQSEHSNVSR
jgi:hypothetical protein